MVDKLHERGAAEVIVPRRADYDLRDIAAIRQLFADVQSGDTQLLNGFGAWLTKIIVRLGLKG